MLNLLLFPLFQTAIQALAERDRDLKIGAKFFVYELEVDENDTDLITPKELFTKGYVLKVT